VAELLMPAAHLSQSIAFFALLHPERTLQGMVRHAMNSLFRNILENCVGLHILNCVSLCNSTTWASSPLFNYSSPTIRFAEIIHRIRVGLFVICKYCSDLEKKTLCIAKQNHIIRDKRTKNGSITAVSARYINTQLDQR
jgi:hypothetical protein